MLAAENEICDKSGSELFRYVVRVRDVPIKIVHQTKPRLGHDINCNSNDMLRTTLTETRSCHVYIVFLALTEDTILRQRDVI